jgi:hypothetical protein
VLENASCGSTGAGCKRGPAATADEAHCNSLCGAINRLKHPRAVAATLGQACLLRASQEFSSAAVVRPFGPWSPGKVATGNGPGVRSRRHPASSYSSEQHGGARTSETRKVAKRRLTERGRRRPFAAGSVEDDVRGADRGSGRRTGVFVRPGSLPVLQTGCRDTPLTERLVVGASAPGLRTLRALGGGHGVPLRHQIHITQAAATGRRPPLPT